jgi:hypothetical protein
MTDRANSLERDFEKALRDAAHASKRDVNYYPAYFWQMLEENGGLRTAQMLLEKKKVSEGFIKLWMAERPDLTVESIILEPRWQPLFSDAEREIARRRLRTGS